VRQELVLGAVRGCRQEHAKVAAHPAPAEHAPAIEIPAGETTLARDHDARAVSRRRVGRFQGRAY